MRNAHKLGIRESEGLAVYLNQISQYPLLTREEERELARKSRLGDEKAREKLIVSNLRLVVKIAGDYSDMGLPLLDLISEGNIGLCKSVERYDPSFPAKLSSYVSYSIKMKIRNALSDKSRIVRIPRNNVKARAQQKISSIDALVHGEESDDEGSTFNDVIDSGAKIPWEDLDYEMRVQRLKETLITLRPRELTVLQYRFLNDEPLTLKETGAKLNLTKERIRQIQNSALIKLRRRLNG